ncbi:MAG: MFS transporter [Dehalococcoidia bacterium]|nr:MFS transporter [Dehalococcoidia bacterium]
MTAPPAIPPTEEVDVTPGLPTRLRTFESLYVPRFRWFLGSTLGLGGGMMMQLLVTGYVVFVLTGSYAALGTVALADAASGFLFGPWGGVIADRFPRRRIVQIGLAASALVALIVATVLALDLLVFWHLIFATGLEGAIFSLLFPSRQAMLPEVVGMDRLQNAVALNMGSMSATRLFAPAVGGALLVVVAPQYVYLLIAGCYLFSAAMLLGVPSTNPTASPALEGGARAEFRRALDDMLDGFRYLAANPTIRALILVNLTVVLFSMPYIMILAGYVLDVLQGGPETIGLLQSIAGIGSVAGTLVVASMPSRRRGAVLLLGPFLMGIALIAFTLSTTIWIVAAIMMFISLGQTIRMSMNNVLVHTHVDDAYRGRVMSIQMMQWTLVSLGGFVLGVLASVIGPVQALRGMAIVLLVLVAAVTVLVPRIRNLD